MTKSYVLELFLFLMFTLLTSCKEDASPVSPVVSNDVEDTWVNEGGFEMTFNANGTVTGSWVDHSNQLFLSLGGEPAPTWTFNTIQMLIDGEPAYPYTVNNNTLVLKYIDGEDLVLTKK
ncbi:MAG TPA: hypothetical protein VKO63_09885 [Chitinispirillaceae bacterium]|nr:hypothetical protein [Chitinispirillaceae bacterium]